MSPLPLPFPSLVHLSQGRTAHDVCPLRAEHGDRPVNRVYLHPHGPGTDPHVWHDAHHQLCPWGHLYARRVCYLLLFCAVGRAILFRLSACPWFSWGCLVSASSAISTGRSKGASSRHWWRFWPSPPFSRRPAIRCLAHLIKTCRRCLPARTTSWGCRSRRSVW